MGALAVLLVGLLAFFLYPYRTRIGRALFGGFTYGRYLHHHPAESMVNPALAGEGIKRTWRLACRKDGIDPERPSRMPALFALDRDLRIPGGFYYALDCRKALERDGKEGGVDVYCASHIGCASCAGGHGGWGGDWGSSGCSGGGCSGGD